MKVLSAILILSLILAGCTVNPQDLAHETKNLSYKPPPGSLQNTSLTNGSIRQLFTLEEVAKHNSKEDCWMVIDGKVLDLSAYIAHPGGDTYVPFCGTDATAGFNDKGGIGRNHSAFAFSLLGKYIIGEIGKPMPADGAIKPPADNISSGTEDALNIPPPDGTALADNATSASNGSIMLTLEEVARHNSAKDCWMVIYGKVLNLTSFTAHPGGSTYVPFCGTDATAAFDNKGGRGNQHSSGAISSLDAYTIGILGQPQNRTVDAANISISGGEDDYEWDDD